MTTEQQRELDIIANRLKKLLPNITGSIEFNLTKNKDKVKYSVKEYRILK